MPYTDQDRYIKANIRSLVNSLKTSPEAVPSLLNLIQNVSSMSSVFDYSKYLRVSGAAGSSLWDLGTNTAPLLKSAAFLLPTLSNENSISTLLRNGLLEELVTIKPHSAENILQNIIIHPLIEEKKHASGMDYLSNQEAVECIQLILNFANNLPPKALADLGQDLANLLEQKAKEQQTTTSNQPSPYLNIIKALVNKPFLEAIFNQPKIIEKKILPHLMQYLIKPNITQLQEVVAGVTELASQVNIREILAPTINYELINNIFNLPQLENSPYRTLVLDLAESRPTEFKKLLNAILSSSAQKDLKPIMSKILNFTDLPKEESPENNKILDDLVLSLIKLVTKPNIKKELVQLLDTKLLDNVFALPQLSDSPYGQLVHNLTARHPKNFQKLAASILSSPFEKELKPVFSKILAFTHLPKENSPENDAIFDDLVVSLVDLLSKPKIRDKLKPLLTFGLIDDIFDLPQLSNSPYRKLVHDLARNQPKELQELFNSMLSSSFEADLKPFISNLLEFTRLSSESPMAEEKFDKLMDSILSMAAKKPIPAKLAPLLTPKIVDNIFALPQSKKISAFKITAKKTASSLSKHPKDIEVLLNTYNGFKHSGNDPIEERDKKILALVDAAVGTLQNKDVMTALTDIEGLKSIAAMLETRVPKPKLNKFTENLRREMPIVLEEERDRIIATCGEIAYKACKTSADLAATSSAKDFSKELTISEIKANPASKKLSIKNYFDIIAAAPPPTHKNIINIISQNNKEIAAAVDLISAKAPNNQVIKLLHNFGIQGTDLTYFGKAVCNPSGLKAIGRYVDNPSTINLARIFIDTNTLAFGIKHLMISYKNYFKEIAQGSEVATKQIHHNSWKEKITQENSNRSIRSIRRVSSE